jgi:hypothetical protein
VAANKRGNHAKGTLKTRPSTNVTRIPTASKSTDFAKAVVGT